MLPKLTHSLSATLQPTTFKSEIKSPKRLALLCSSHVKVTLEETLPSKCQNSYSLTDKNSFSFLLVSKLVPKILGVVGSSK